MAKGKYETWLEPDNLTRLEAWARDGLTQQQIAHNIGCSLSTLKEWIKTYPAISAALKKGREVADIEVENALIKRALGYSYEETMVEHNPDGTRKTRVTKKFIPPDVAAIVFYLKNRRPSKWRDKPVDESDSAALTAARELLAGIPSVINDHRPSPGTNPGAGYASATQALHPDSQAKPDLRNGGT